MLRKIFVSLITICAIVFSFNSAECRKVIFVINTGQTMKISDPFHEIPESIIWSAENLSANDEIGIITFGEIPRVIRPLSSIKDNPIDNLQIEYSGKSNASAALLQAVDILSQKFNTDRTIIFFTDGENLLDEKSQNIMFVENVKAGLRQAQWLGIPVYILSLRADVNPQNYHSYEWAKEIPLNYLDLMSAIRTIFHNDFKTPHLEIFTKNISNNNLEFEVPISNPEKLKIILLSSSAGNATLNNFSNVASVKRNFINIFELNAPTTNKFEMTTNYPQGTGLTLDVIPTVNGILQTEISSSLFAENVLEITPVYRNNSDSKILADKFFDNKTVALQINDKNFWGKVKDGTINLAIPNAEENISLQKVHFEDLGIIFEGDDTAQLKNPKNSIAWIIALLAISVILILSWLIHKKNYSVASAAILSAEKNIFSFKGKLKICARNAEDSSPREFNLFRLNSAQISLSKILEECNFEDFQNVEGIIIKPAAQGILIENNSNCTITKENILIEHGKIIELNYNDSIIIAPVNLILTFESLKPN